MMGKCRNLRGESTNQETRNRGSFVSIFQHFRHLASFFRLSDWEFTSIQSGLIAARAQHFFLKIDPLGTLEGVVDL